MPFLIMVSLRSLPTNIAWGRFVEQKLMLSSNFRCDQIFNNHCYVFGHTLLCYLSPTWMFNKPTSDWLICSSRVGDEEKRFVRLRPGPSLPDWGLRRRRRDASNRREARSPSGTTKRRRVGLYRRIKTEIWQSILEQQGSFTISH